MEDKFFFKEEDESTEKYSPRLSKKKVIAIAAGLIVLTVAIFTGVWLKSSNDYPHNHLSASAIFYTQLNMDPSVGQKVAAFQLLQDMPTLTDSAFADVKQDDFTSKILEELYSLKLSEPWLGDRMAVALYPDDRDLNSTPEVAIVLETKNDGAAAKDIAMLSEAFSVHDVFGAVDPYEGALLNDKWVGFTSGDFEAIFKSGKPLTNLESFKAQHKPIQKTIASLWLDPRGLSRAMNIAGYANFKATGAIVASVEAKSDGLEITGLSSDLKNYDKPAYLKGDPGRLQKLAGEHGYSDAALTLGFIGFAPIAEYLDTHLYVYFNMPTNSTFKDIRGLSGNEAFVSIEGEAKESLSAEFVMGNTKKEAWDEAIQVMPSFLTGFASNGKKYFDQATEAELREDRLLLQVGEERASGEAIGPAPIYGFMNIDKFLAILHDYGVTGKQFDKGLGTLKLTGTSSEDSSQFKLRWTTAR